MFAPQLAAAHPHVFIDAGLEVTIDDTGQLTHVKVTWAYDAFYSLLVASDMGLDKDGDGILTAAEEAKLAGFDAKWAPGYNGDMIVRLDGQALKMSGPVRSTAQMIEGQIVTTHLREVTGTPVLGGDSLSLKVFDETYYTAFQLTLPVTLNGGQACTISRQEPDIDGELARMQAMLLSIDADADLEEMDIPMMGEAFATEILIRCAAS